MLSSPFSPMKKKREGKKATSESNQAEKGKKKKIEE